MEQKTCDKCGSGYYQVCFHCHELKMKAIKEIKDALEKRDPIAAAIDREFQNLPKKAVKFI